MINKNSVKSFLIISLGDIIVAAAVYFFMIPSHLSVGSCAAFAMVLSNFIPLSVSLITLLINIILLIVGFIFIGPEFGIKTVYCAVLMPVTMGVFELIFPNFQSITQDPLIDLICYILVVGIGLAILFSRNASSGGLDIVTMLLNKYLGMDMGRAMSAAGMVIALSSALCYDSKTVILSLLGTYFGGIVVDHFIFGMNIKRRVCVISDKLEEILDYVLHELHSGATLNDITGGWDRTPRTEMITIVDKHEYRRLMDHVRKIDPEAFVTVYSVNDVRYRPKNKNT